MVPAIRTRLGVGVFDAGDSEIGIEFVPICVEVLRSRGVPALRAFDSGDHFDVLATASADHLNFLAASILIRSVSGQGAEEPPSWKSAQRRS